MFDHLPQAISLYLKQPEVVLLKRLDLSPRERGRPSDSPTKLPVRLPYTVCLYSVHVQYGTGVLRVHCKVKLYLVLRKPKPYEVSLSLLLGSKERIHNLRQRKEVAALRNRQEEKYACLLRQLNQADLEQKDALISFRSSVYQKKRAGSLLSLSQQWNVISDCFHISHRGPFGTINGLRLGSEAAAVDLAVDDSVHQSRRPFSIIEGKAGQAATVRIPWIEINAALGHLALLLSTLESRTNAGISLRHVIVPLGSYSKIGIRGRSDSVSLYNLYSDDSFQFFGKRNFNTALQCMAECVVDAAEAIQKHDRTIAIPHVIENQRDCTTVGGISIAYGNDGVEWTRAMKYLLTDVKHLLTYKALGLWD